jgi:hypothetical protein
MLPSCRAAEKENGGQGCDGPGALVLPRCMPELATRIEPLTPVLSARVNDFARACKAAIRAVSLYPDGHPAIGASLARLVGAAERATERGPLTLAVTPDALLVDQRASARPEPAVTELAGLLHEHLVGELRVAAAADGEAWRSFLLLLAQPPGDVQRQGGITRLWTCTGAQHVHVREVNYAEVLRARESGIAARWEDIIEHCLQGDAVALDREMLQTLLDIAEQPERLATLLEDLHARSPRLGDPERQAASILELLRHVAAAVGGLRADRAEVVLVNFAAASERLSPEVMLAIVDRRYDAPPPGTMNVVDSMLTRMTDATVGQFVARSIVEQRGATERLAEAFQALVPESARRQRLLAGVREHVADSPLGQDASFEMLWQRATDMLTSYKDEPFVSDAYARELSGARGRASEVEQIADDPPEVLAAWLATITDAAVRDLDLQLLLDLLVIEPDPGQWREITQTVTAHLEDLALLGDFEAALPLIEALAAAAAPHRPHRSAADMAIEHLTRGSFIAHLVDHLRTIEDEGLTRVQAVCRALGPIVIRPLADALVVEERGRGFRRLTDLIVGFGSAGREAAEQLKGSANPAVRRTAIYLLREFGGNEALPDLTSLLGDAEPNVQRDAVRAIALIGTDAAFSVLQQALTSGTNAQREAIINALGAMRDERAVPLFCHIVRQDGYRRTLQRAWLAAVEGLGAVGGDDAVRTLSDALRGGQWWAPCRTAALRRTVASTLRRVGTPAALHALRTVVATGPRGARAAAREQLAGGGGGRAAARDKAR